ncbi:FG-GAP-like repeat-containing protein [Bradyrhizobium genosp. L]|uniref:FG-GAP-like repeat-containing protein n=1 Tax=Bradyrhizobium genosp. L TaxID=83637 RepID=UPI001FED6397|nr:FG-GAP-like repeat-containing protein [Bradyrhizobium genosp. L]
MIDTWDAGTSATPVFVVLPVQAPLVSGSEFPQLDAGLAALVQPSVGAFEAINSLASLANPVSGSSGSTSAAASAKGATAGQVQQALGESGLSGTGSGIKVGVISDSFNDLGGAAADEASGALPSAANIQVLEDRSSGGTDEGRAMMQIVHEIAPGASLAFYTADVSEQDFANGILALAAAGCKVICDDVSYFDEPFFQNGIVAQAIQTVESEGVTYVTAAGNNASNAYQAAWRPTFGIYDGFGFADAESFGGSMVLNITVTASKTNPSPLLLEWDQAYGAATADLVLNVFQNGTYLGAVSNRSVGGVATNPWTGLQFTASGTYQIVIENLSSISNSDPTMIKLVSGADGLPVTISGADTGTVFGHAMTPGAITAGAVNVASVPVYGVSPAQSESFSSSGAGTELLFANDGTRLSTPDLLSPVAVSGLDNIATTLSGGLGDFYGTSAASASLAGVAALMLAANPNLTPAQVEHFMELTALPMADAAVSGAGLVQADAAVAAALSGIAISVAAQPLDVSTGGDHALTSGFLAANDSVDAADLHYTVASDPSHGTLLLDGAETTSFTQAEIDSGRVTYHETGLGVSADSFQYSVSDPLGATSQVQTFNVNVDTSNPAASHATGLFNGGSQSDILWYSDDGTVSLWNDGQSSGAHWIASPGTIADTSHIEGVGDFDGNGQSDILWRGDDGAVFIWDNGQPTDSRSVAAAGVVPAGWHIAGVGDFDGNGQSDIVWRNDNGTLSLWDDGQIGSAHWIATGDSYSSSWHIVGVGDFDGNGHSDILWQNDNGALSIWDNGQINAAHVIASPGAVASSWHIAGIGDFDGNGHSDILWQNDDGAVSIWDNGQINAAHIVASPGSVAAGWHVAGIGDFDGNGRSDILWQNDNGAVSIWDDGQLSGAHIVAAAASVPGTWHIA